MSANSQTPTRVAPFFTILFLLFSVGACSLIAYNHNDNTPAENVVRNDDFAKMGGTGYSPNHQATPAAEAPVAVTEEHAAEANQKAEDTHAADAHKADAGKSHPKGH